MSKQDGGPAFPLGITEAASYALKGERDASMGMSLRDYFAAKAMQGFCNRIGHHDAVVMAHDAYIVADAMLAERNRK